jgi:EmrB/QacA subfamily drug resistance transporter
VCLGAFIGQVDASIMSLVLPTLEQEFHASLGTVQWVAIAYLLVLTGLLTPLGYLADDLGRKTLYTVGFVVFILGSALCGLAPDLPFLIGGRLLQGIGAAMLQANSVAIVTAAVPYRQLGRAIGVQGTAQALGLAIGPAVGGFLIAWLSWRWVFFINLPIGLVGAVLARYTLPRTEKKTTARGEFNYLGAATLPLGVATVLLGFTFLSVAWAFLPLAVVLFSAFVVTERRAAGPLLAPEVLRAPGLVAGLVAALLSYTVLFGGLLAVPLLLERVFAQTPDRAGLMLTIVPAVLALVAALGGVLTDRFGPRVPTVSGMALAAGGLVLIGWATAPGGLVWYAGLMLFGLGSGLFIPANNASVMQVAPGSRLGLAGGLINMMRGIGASFGVALVGAALAVRVGNVPTHTVHPAAVWAGLRWAIAGLAVAALLAGLLSVARRSHERQ